MRRAGYKKIPTTIPGHQDCGICHEPTKAGRSYDKSIWIREADEDIMDRNKSDRAFVGVCGACFQEITYAIIRIDTGTAVDGEYSGDTKRVIHPHNDEYGFRRCIGIGQEPYGPW